MEPTNRTPAGDQYSLGCTLYYCLTGQYPFPDGSAVEKMMAHQTKEPSPIKDVVAEVPDGLADVIKKLMAKKPEERFNGCDEVVEALEPYLGELTEAAAAATASAAQGFSRGGVALLDRRDRRRTLGGVGQQVVTATHPCGHVARELERMCLETVSVSTC